MSCSNDKTIKIWNYESLELIHTLTGHKLDVRTLAHIQNTKLILSGSRDESIKIWNYETS